MSHHYWLKCLPVTHKLNLCKAVSSHVFGGEHMFICTLTDGEKAEKAKGQIAKHWKRLLVLIPWEIPAVHLSWQCCSLWSMQVLQYAIKWITLYRRSSSRNVVLLNSVWIFNWIPEWQYLIIFQPVLWFLNLQPFVASQFASVCLNTHPKPQNALLQPLPLSVGWQKFHFQMASLCKYSR